MEQKEIKILIADDHPIFRRGLRSVVENETNFVVVGEAENGVEAVKMVEQLKPDMVILDVDMPLMDGIETAKKISAMSTSTKISFLTIHKNLDILKAMKDLSVTGYILKDSALIEIVSCIEHVMSGKMFISSAVFEAALSKKKAIVPADNVDAETLISVLTPAESRILGCIAMGLTSRDISEHLFVSVRTVENHRFNICSKLDLRGNNSLLKFALENKETILRKQYE